MIKNIKKIHKLFFSLVLFVVLFYNLEMALNLGIFTLIVWVLTFLNLPAKRQGKTFWLLSGAVFISIAAFSWYGDFASFIALFLSAFILGIYTQYKRLSILAYPVFAFYSFASFIVRIFFTRHWVPKSKLNHESFKKIALYFLLPVAIALLFIIVYTASSDTFAGFFKLPETGLDPLVIVVLSVLGFYLLFNYWFILAPKALLLLNQRFQDKFVPRSVEVPSQNIKSDNQKMELRGGEISLVLLNLVLLCFLFAYNYDQYFQKSEIDHLSSDVHQRINSVILSIVMAIALIMFYFRSTFNHHPGARLLKQLTYCWIALNTLLVLSTFIKNIEYVQEFGLTFKRIGVFIFLILCFYGLAMTLKKIKLKWTNSFLSGKILQSFFITIVLSAAINWSWIATKYNLSCQQHPDYYYLKSMDFNRGLLYDHFKNAPQWQQYLKDEQRWIQIEKSKPFLSKNLYYQLLSF